MARRSPAPGRWTQVRRGGWKGAALRLVGRRCEAIHRARSLRLLLSPVSVVANGGINWTGRAPLRPSIREMALEPLLVKKSLDGEQGPGGEIRGFQEPTPSETFPLLRAPKDLFSKIYFWPIVLTMVAALTVVRDKDDFRLEVAGYICALISFVIYKLCAKRQSVLVMAGIAAFTASFTFLYSAGRINQFAYFFLDLAGGSFPGRDDTAAWQAMGPLVALWKVFTFTGLAEELIKATPVLVIFWGARWLPQTPFVTNWLRVKEPLDGIVFAAVSAAGFAFVETAHVYAFPIALKGDSEGALHEIIVRLAGELPRHVAWAGYFGYFIGLAALRRRSQLRLLLVGWFCTAALHAFWDTPIFLQQYTFFIIPIGALSYLLLGAAIMKARQISPTRVGGSSRLNGLLDGSAEAGVRPPPTDPSPAARLVNPSNIAPPVHHPAPEPDATTLQLRLGLVVLPLTVGTTLYEDELPGLKSKAQDRSVARVTGHPADPAILGLQNLSVQKWTATLVSGAKRIISTDDVVRLDRSARIDFAGSEGLIER